MATDPTISLGVKAPEALDVVGMASKYGALANTLNQNRLFQAKQAVGAAVQQATNPMTGQVDWDAAKKLIAQSPAAAMGAPEFATQALEGQGKEIANATAKTGLANTQVQALAAAVGTLKDDATPGDVAGRLAFLQKSGQISPDLANETAGSLPDDPEALKTWIHEMRLRSLSPEGALTARFGAPTAINTGGQTQVEAISPSEGTADPLLTLKNTLSPSELASRQPAYVPGGPGQPGHMASVAQSDLVNPDGTPKTPGQALQTAPALGEEPAASTAGAGSANMLTSLRSDVAGSAARTYQLGQALHGLETSNTGPGTQETNNIRSFLLAQAPGLLKAAGLDQKAIEETKSYDEANKYLTAYVTGQAGAMGSDTKLATALSGNASTHISNLAAKDVVRAAIGLERVKQAQVQAFDNSGLSPDQFGAFTSKWNTTTDPRAYIVDMMPAAQRKAMIDKMNPTEKALFFNSLRAGVSAGIPGLVNMTAKGAQ